MSSFYGNGGGTGSGGISPSEVDAKIAEAKELMKNHIYFSKTEPTVQKAGDVWMVLTEFSDLESDLVQALKRRREGN